ncbi:uncharacterized protein B0H18DRAFT_965430 [Fomitopsis serialis]|uniref:uncharacterized protein n=1 Tax=Fomitopsis serialis TaxID=139415 RepID=UPI0020080276|nr:uncharacterized protein B0H18DRAFT_965430 [Neoantrodia serialis]KAH9938084.1 hypothetical protein B0H18DRAFT_965430 [Neoantrodia serialis]
MASNAQGPSKGHAQGKKPAGTARYLSSTSASSSRAAAAATPTSSSSSSKRKPPLNAKIAKPVSHTAANGTSTVKPTKSGGHASGSVPVRSVGMKASSSVGKNLAPSSSSSSLSQKTVSKDKQPASVDVTRDQATPLTTLDASQQAAQLQSWLFMSAKLETIEQRRAELSAEEADIADARLMAPHVASAIASLEACSRILSEALQLAQRPANEIWHVGHHEELYDRSEHDSRVVLALLALLPVVRAQGANLDCARTVIQSSKSNLRAVMRLQSLQSSA